MEIENDNQNTTSSINQNKIKNEATKECKVNEEQAKFQSFSIITEDLKQGDFSKNKLTYINETEDSTEEYLIFVVHGIGQNEEYLEYTMSKIAPVVKALLNNKKNMLNKQIHIRLVNWKHKIIMEFHDHLQELVNLNDSSKVLKGIIHQTPLDILFYSNIFYKYEILNDIVDQINDYYDIVVKYRKLFKGNVSILAHSLGSVIMYDILTMMKFAPRGEMPNISNFTNENEFETKKSNIDLNPKIKNSSFASSKTSSTSAEINANTKDDEDFRTSKDPEFNNARWTVDIGNIGNSGNLNSFKEGNSRNLKIISKNDNLKSMLFAVDHFFLMGSPLSLFLTVNKTDKSRKAAIEVNDFEIVKDFHNIMHPMDPIAYRIEPLIHNFPIEDAKKPYTISHWENEGIRNPFWNNVLKILCYNSLHDDKDDEQSGYCNNGCYNGTKRYDFTLQECPSEKAFKLSGLLFSHTDYWNNPDVFYFIFKIIHMQGYSSPFKSK